ncbi:hypothetical protein MMC07_006422 [Pseudocyphellaria aurata]|nr:hypothetical protein [Pseudocyphellaria aurata]
MLLDFVRERICVHLRVTVDGDHFRPKPANATYPSSPNHTHPRRCGVPSRAEPPGFDPGVDFRVLNSIIVAGCQSENGMERSITTPTPRRPGAGLDTGQIGLAGSAVLMLAWCASFRLFSFLQPASLGPTKPIVLHSPTSQSFHASIGVQASYSSLARFNPIHDLRLILAQCRARTMYLSSIALPYPSGRLICRIEMAIIVITIHHIARSGAFMVPLRRLARGSSDSRAHSA